MIAKILMKFEELFKQRAASFASHCFPKELNEN